MDELNKILQQQYKNLPEDVKRAIGTDNWRNTLKTLKWKYNLSAEDSETLNTETVLALFGLESYKDFKNNLISQNISVPKETIADIASEVDKVIFEPIRNSLDEIDSEEMKKESQNKEAPQEKTLVIGENGKKEEEIRQEMQHEIEYPQKTPPAFEKKFSIPQSSNILEDKLGKVVKLPHEKTEKTEREPPKPTNHYGGVDPYREALE